MDLQDVLKLRDDVDVTITEKNKACDEDSCLHLEFMRDQLDSILDWTVLCGSTGQDCPLPYCVTQIRNQVFKNMGCEADADNWDIYQRIYELVAGMLESESFIEVQSGMYQGMWTVMAIAQCRSEVSQLMAGGIPDSPEMYKALQIY